MSLRTSELKSYLEDYSLDMNPYCDIICKCYLLVLSEELLIKTTKDTAKFPYF